MGFNCSSIGNYRVFDKSVSEWHVIPQEDIFDHREDIMCNCRPNIEIFADSMVVTHNSFDGREAVQMAMKIRRVQILYPA